MQQFRDEEWLSEPRIAELKPVLCNEAVLSASRASPSKWRLHP
jgi:hypothetical protein